MFSENQYRRIYDKLQKKPNIPKETYPLNKINIQKYLDNVKDPKKTIVDKIFKHTRHISYKTFTSVLIERFKEFINYCKTQNIKSVVIYFDDIMNIDLSTGSTRFWVIQHFIQFIKNENIELELFIIYDKNEIKYIQENQLVVIMDDCAYSGDTLSKIIMHFNKINNRPLKCYIIVAFISENAMKVIEENRGNFTIIMSKKHELIYPMAHYLTDKEIKFYDSIVDVKEEDVYKIHDKYPVYFDHKLADHMVTYTQLYNGYISQKKIIPVISNCDHIDTAYKIDLRYPRCPPEPYKNNLESAKKSPSPKQVGSNHIIDPERQKEIIKRFRLEDLRNFILELKKPPRIPKKTYPINKLKIYHTDANLLSKIIKNINHVSYKTFKTVLYGSFKSFISHCNSNKIRSITIVINTDTKYTSTFWVVQHFFQYMRENSIKFDSIDYIANLGDIRKQMNENYVIMDDCMYYYQDNTYNSIGHMKTKNNFYIISPYITNDIYKHLVSYPNVQIFDHTIIHSTAYYLTAEELELIKKSTLYIFYIKPLIYFDHSIGKLDVPLFEKLKIPCMYEEEVKTKTKECPAGKIINPKTGRCIKIKIKKEKECPAGKIINPKTGRCIKIKK